MEEFGFKEVEEVIDIEFNTNNDINKKSYNSNRKSNKFNKQNKSKEKKINLFKELPKPREIEPDKFKRYKNFSIVIANDSLVIPTDVMDKLESVLDILSKKGYIIRYMCDKSNTVFPTIVKHLDKDKIYVVKPWEKYCDNKSYKTLIPTNVNMELAAQYVKNFDKLPAGVKYITSAQITTILGPYGNMPLDFIIFIDPYSNFSRDGKIDFKQSTNTYNFYSIIRNMKDLNIGIYNILNDIEYDALLAYVK